MEIERVVLEELYERVEDRRDELVNVLDDVSELISKIDNDLAYIQTVMDNDALSKIKKTKKPKKLDPKNCIHINKYVETDSISETVKCVDCDLLLSYRLLK